MRPHLSRAGAAGTLLIAGAGTATLAATAHAASPTPVLKASDRVTAGKPARAVGLAPGASGRTIALQHRVSRSGAWRQIATTRVKGNDRFRFKAAVPRSGVLRAALVPSAGAAAASASGTTTNEQRIAVARAVRVSGRKLHVRSGRTARVKGKVAPGTSGLPVRLQARRGGRWRTIDRGRTKANGRYRLADKVSSTGRAKLRVVTAGKDGFAKGRRKAGRLHVYRYAHASWYGPGFYGNTLGCGGTFHHGQLGVAHKTLPCGTKVTFRRGNRSVTVKVIDRGPYIAGREYDLTEATAQRLGFRGHGPVLATR